MSLRKNGKERSEKPASQTKPKFSNYHPIIPKNYTPAWKLDMKNRGLIVENAQSKVIPHDGLETTLYLEKRERFSSSEDRQEVMNKVPDVSEERMLRPWFHSPLSKYQSKLMFHRVEES